MQSVKWYACPMRDLGIERCTCCNMGHCTCSTSPNESYCGFHHTVYNYIIVRCFCTLNTCWPATVSGCCEPSTHTPEITYHWNEFIVYMAGVQCTLVKSMHGMQNVAGRNFLRRGRADVILISDHITLITPCWLWVVFIITLNTFHMSWPDPKLQTVS